MGGRLANSMVSDKAKDLPGPGNYNVHSNNKPKDPAFGFGTSKRPAMNKTSIGPGPGAYRLRNTVGNVAEYAMPNRKDEDKYV